MTRLAVLAAAILVVLAPSSAGAAKVSKKRNFALQYTPTETAENAASPCSGSSATLKVEPFADERPDTSRIGMNLEKEKSPAPVVGQGDLGAFVAQALEKELRASGCNVAADGARVVKGTITELSVDLDGTYKGRVAIRVTIGGATIAGQGSATRFSMLESPENYLQALSDALFHAVRQVVESDEFRKAVSG